MITHTARHRLSKALCISMAIVYGWCSSISPARAFAPVAVLAAPQIVTAGGAYFVGASAGLVGMLGMYLLVKDATDNEVAIPLGTNPANAVPQPEAAGTVTPTTSTTTDGVGWSYGSSGCHPTMQAACSAIAGQYGYADRCLPPAGVDACTWSSSACTYGFLNPGSCNTASVTTPTCPGGYSVDGTGCTLQNARRATDDKRCDLLLQNGQFATADDMNCGTDVDGTKAAPLIRDGKAIVIGTNSSGQPLIVTVAPSETVGDREWITVTTQEQIQTATQTQVKSTTATIDPQTSTITSIQTQTKPGVVTLPSGSTVPTISPTTDVTTSPTVTTDTSTQTQPDITINTCGLPGQPACAIDDTGFASQGRPWEVQPEGPTLNDIKDKITNVEAPSFGWDWLPSILPGQSVQCHPLEFTGTITAGPAAGMTASEPLDLCPYFDYVRLFLGFLFGAGTVLYIWKRFTGAKTASAWEE